MDSLSQHAVEGFWIMYLKCPSMSKYLQKRWNLAHAETLNLSLSQPLSLKMACIELATQDMRWTSVCCPESAGLFFSLQMEIFRVVVHHISKKLSWLRMRPTESACSLTLHAVTCFAFDILLWVKQLALMCHEVVAIKKISSACLCCHQRGAILKAKEDSVNHKRKIKFPSPSAQSAGIICTPAQSQPVGKL